jgi:hypothetical protein
MCPNCANPCTKGSNIAFLHIPKKEEVTKTVHSAFNNGVNPLFSKETRFLEMYCRFLGKEYQVNEEQIKGEVVEEGRGDPIKTIKVIRHPLEKLGANMEDHWRKSQGPSQTTQNADELETHAHHLKHLEDSSK